ncbi:MAG: dephospho-CoA kinase [Candidatus Omnitrophica bacterium]|nr:dephospho-CoA kinase [Candidatus Omnitrophota bacterium]MDD5236266.1 dephospho-CoA kinase [Candidatus Omnitrophota bacterium]MDD5610876.1 dephospho-CoA kinase [Candidatus Omnitrophota bacterium]
MKVLGLTGSWGTGKTTVARMFKRLGANIIDADKIAHCLIRPHSAVYRQIVSVFGKRFTKPGSPSIDRKKLARAAFANKVLLKKLNKIMHPAIILGIKLELKKNRSKLVVLDAPLLIETGLDSITDKLIVVSLDKAEQLKRLKRKTGLSSKDIKRRISSQLPLGTKIKKADFVIDNNGTKKNTYQQVKAVCKKLNEDTT